MMRAHSGSLYSLRYELFGLAAIAAMTVSCNPANARHHSGGIAQSAHVDTYSPPTSWIVVDGNTGAVLHTSNPDASRHPASLTKIMTLYLLFERLQERTIKLDTPLRVSEHAAKQAPTKLGLSPGQTIAVEDAIKAVVTKSANDVAVTIAENLGGGEVKFAKLMTEKAHALGMSHTNYVNASGLPDDDQNTTARDQARRCARSTRAAPASNDRVDQARSPRHFRQAGASPITRAADLLAVDRFGAGVL
jgi:D-alanyl-D-alanine carboxypeptidase